MAKNNKRQQKDFSLVHKLQGIGTQVTRNWYTSYKELVHKLQGIGTQVTRKPSKWIKMRKYLKNQYILAKKQIPLVHKLQGTYYLLLPIKDIR